MTRGTTSTRVAPSQNGRTDRVISSIHQGEGRRHWRGGISTTDCSRADSVKYSSLHVGTPYRCGVSPPLDDDGQTQLGLVAKFCFTFINPSHTQNMTGHTKPARRKHHHSFQPADAAEPIFRLVEARSSRPHWRGGNTIISSQLTQSSSRLPNSHHIHHSLLHPTNTTDYTRAARRKHR